LWKVRKGKKGKGEKVMGTTVPTDFKKKKEPSEGWGVSKRGTVENKLKGMGKATELQVLECSRGRWPSKTARGGNVGKTVRKPRGGWEEGVEEKGRGDGEKRCLRTKNRT